MCQMGVRRFIISKKEVDPSPPFADNTAYGGTNFCYPSDPLFNPVTQGLLWGHSSAGRAPALQAGGRRFDPVWLHHRYLKHSLKNKPSALTGWGLFSGLVQFWSSFLLRTILLIKNR